MTDWLNHNPVWAALLRAVLFAIPTLLLVPIIIWYERRLLGWMQDRIGPNRVGPFGLLQPIADVTKLAFKEDITPKSIDHFIYFLAPVLSLFPAFTLGGTIPWGPFPLLTPVADVNIGILYILAISSLGVYGLVLAGYSANNKFSLMGGLRASAQLISYELAMGMSLACIVLSVGSLKPSAMVSAQSGALWGLEKLPLLSWISNWNLFTPYGVVAAVIFFICMIAETNRAPFDLPEAENELVAGYHTEYSSLKFAVFFMGEYAAMIVWSAIFATVFMGGWHLLPIRFEYLAQAQGGIWGTLETIDRYGAPIWLVGKVAFLGTVYIWVRGSLPRLRYDQLMSLGWKTLLPTATANLILVATWIVVAAVTQQAAAGLLAYLIAAVLLYGLFRAYRNSKPKVAALEEHRRITLVKPGTPKPSSADPEATPAPT